MRRHEGFARQGREGRGVGGGGGAGRAGIKLSASGLSEPLYFTEEEKEEEGGGVEEDFCLLVA